MRLVRSILYLLSRKRRFAPGYGREVLYAEWVKPPRG